METISKIVIVICCLMNAANLSTLFNRTPKWKTILNVFKKDPEWRKPMWLFYIPSFIIYGIVRFLKYRRFV